MNSFGTIRLAIFALVLCLGCKGGDTPPPSGGQSGPDESGQSTTSVAPADQQTADATDRDPSTGGSDVTPDVPADATVAVPDVNEDSADLPANLDSEPAQEDPSIAIAEALGNGDLAKATELFNAAASDPEARAQLTQAVKELVVEDVGVALGGNDYDAAGKLVASIRQMLPEDKELAVLDALTQARQSLAAGDFATVDTKIADAKSQAPDGVDLNQSLHGMFRSQMSTASQAGDMPQLIRVLELALKHIPGDPSYGLSMIALRSQYGEQLLLEDPAKSAEEFIATGKVAREVFAAAQGIPEQYQRFLGTALFNEARGLAQMNRMDDAKKSLGDAFDAGFEEYSRVEDDTLLASIASDASFQSWLAERIEPIRAKFREEARKLIAEQQTFPFDFELPDMDQQPVKLADFRGKVVIVDVWGTWCPPCIAEIPHFVKLQDKFSNDLAIIGINYENGSPETAVPKIKQFMLDKQMNYACVLGDDDTRNQIPDFQGFPTTLFLDREGNVRLKVVGLHPYEQLVEFVTELIESGRSES